MPTVFISYRREDSAGYAGRLHEELEERLGGGTVFRDVDTLRAGQDFEEAIRARLHQCSACIVMIGPGWVKSQTASGLRRLDQPGDYVVMEIAAALTRPDVLVVPVLVGGASMPSPDDLPESIRPLARRHAFSVRDETWEADMDRLAATIDPDGLKRRAATTRPDATRGGGRRSVVLPTLLVIGVLAALVIAWRVRPSRANSPEQPPVTHAAASEANTDGGAAAGTANAIDIPSRGAEVVLGDLIYTPVAGSLLRRGPTTTVWLRVRVSNDSAYPANLWDASFRLVADGSVVAPNGGLNEVLDGHSIRQAIVRFEVPSATTRATLRIGDQSHSGDVPLDLVGNGQPAHHEQPDSGDALSRATITSVGDGAQTLLRAGDLSASVTRIINRHFANAQRLRLEISWQNNGRYPVATGDLVLRLDAGGETLAPFSYPSEAVSSGASFRGDAIFDVAPTIRQAVLKVSLGGSSREIPLMLK